MHSAENTGDVRCLTDAPLPFFVRVLAFSQRISNRPISAVQISLKG